MHLTELCSTEDIKTLLQEESKTLCSNSLSHTHKAKSKPALSHTHFLFFSPGYLHSWDVYECVRLHPTVLNEVSLSSSLGSLQLQRMALVSNTTHATHYRSCDARFIHAVLIVFSQEAREEEEELQQQETETLDSQLLLHHGRRLLEEYLEWKELAGIPRDSGSIGNKHCV